MAENVAIYSTVLTWARPPQMLRRPRIIPLSRLKGATPTKAAIQFADLRQLGQDRGGEHGAHARDTAQEAVLLPPERM
jgi:hypothetical protein